MNIKFFEGESFPLEMHKVKIVQKLNLPSIDERLEAIGKAGNNTFLLENKDVFLDMLTDSGVNAMSDRQEAAMLIAEDSYAGSSTFTRLHNILKDIFKMEFFLPAHQGRACENIISQSFVKKDSFIPMNFHFTTTRSHININGGQVFEGLIDEGLVLDSNHPFKGNMDIDKLESFIEEKGREKISFVRMEAGTNLIGGQPFSLENLRQVGEVCRKNNLMLILDASLLADNLYFIKTREKACSHMSIEEITEEIAKECDIIYFSGRKLGSARGGGICTNNEKLYKEMREFVTLYEGFLTYGGMSVREMEALAVGLEETMDMNVISQGPEFIEFMVRELDKRNIPVVKPSGGLGCHINAGEFLSHIDHKDYPAGSLAVALYLVSGIRGMERGTMSEDRDTDGNEVISDIELLRLALPRRVFTLSQVKYAIDRISWLHENRHLVGGLEFTEEPSILRFFFGRLKPKSNWQEKLVDKFKEDFGDSL